MGVGSAIIVSNVGKAARRRLVSALLGFAFLLFVDPLEAQRRHGPSPLNTLGEDASQEVGWEVLKQFRSLGIAGDYRFRFQLQVMPRREKTRIVPGMLLGSMGPKGPVTRVDIALKPAEVGDAGNLEPAEVQRFLLQNGLFASAYQADSQTDGAPKRVPSNKYFDPLAGSDFTVFDLLMPYTFWQRFHYEGRTTFRGRPTHVFWMYPPDEDKLMKEKVSGVRIFLDDEFHALIQAEVYNSEEVHAKTVTIVDFRKTDGQWILSQVDVRNELTRDKTRFKVTDAALDVDLPEWVFTPEGLERNVYGTELAMVPSEARADPNATEIDE